MPIENRAQLLISRRNAERTKIDRASTLRQDHTLQPLDVNIKDLSCGGCKISGEVSIVVGDEVGIGLPGIGSCIANVIWVTNGTAGVAFLQPLTDDDVDSVRHAQTLVEGHFRCIMRTIPSAHATKPLSIFTPPQDSCSNIYFGLSGAPVIVGATIVFWFSALLTAWAIAP